MGASLGLLEELLGNNSCSSQLLQRTGDNLKSFNRPKQTQNIILTDGNDQEEDDKLALFPKSYNHGEKSCLSNSNYG